ncbi:hypothetical protein PAMA_016995 [Pampus argenteus]
MQVTVMVTGVSVRPVVNRTSQTSKKAQETLSLDCSELVQEAKPLPNDDHSYALPSSHDDLRARLREALARVESLKRERRNAQDREKRAMNTVSGLLQDLRVKKLINEELKEQLDIYSDLPIHLLSKQSHEYTKDQREFAITLHLHGPKAYSYMRETLNINLPHPHTLQRPPPPNVEGPCGSDMNVTIITELRKFRQEVNETLEKLSEQVSSLDHTVRGLGGRVSEVEERVSNVEDEHSRHGQLLSFLLHRDRQLEARCEALENAQRRENLRIYGIKEGSEQGDTVEWIDKFLHELLKLPSEFELRLDRAHRSLVKKKPADDKELVFDSAWEAADGLRHLGIEVELSEE